MTLTSSRSSAMMSTSNSSFKPLEEGVVPVYRYRSRRNPDCDFDVALTSDPNCIVITTRGASLFDHLRLHYHVEFLIRSGSRGRSCRYYSIGLSMEAFIHFVAWNRALFRTAGGSKDYCAFLSQP